MRYDHLEDHFDINNDGELDFMEKNMMEAYVWEAFRADEEENEESAETYEDDDYDDFGDGEDD